MNCILSISLFVNVTNTTLPRQRRFFFIPPKSLGSSDFSRLQLRNVFCPSRSLYTIFPNVFYPFEEQVPQRRFLATDPCCCISFPPPAVCHFYIGLSFSFFPSIFSSDSSSSYTPFALVAVVVVWSEKASSMFSQKRMEGKSR